MSSEGDNLLTFNQYMKSTKMAYIVFAEIESFIEKTIWMCKQSKNFFKQK